MRSAVAAFEAHALEFAVLDPTEFKRWLQPLLGKDPVCWCPRPEPCHADVLLELANT